jgi:hypothetical protein
MRKESLYGPGFKDLLRSARAFNAAYETLRRMGVSKESPEYEERFALLVEDELLIAKQMEEWEAREQDDSGR